MARAEDKRRSARLYHELPVAYRSVGSFLSDWATNISQSGLFINARRSLPVGTIVKLIIQIPGAAFPVDVMGRVTRVSEAVRAPGMGIEFVGLDSEKRERIDEFVEKLRRDLGAD
ncbi:MAG TPA: TIGR02266 family protein [Anaeromyxobacteraceae bacterium]|nr:TIGR02266 family protein [Anaeromyxobacteraceae bacterium]